MSGRKHHHTSKGRSWFYRLLRFRLVLPLLRSHHPPQFAARGTAVGLILAFTPTIGLHTICPASAPMRHIAGLEERRVLVSS